MGPFLLVSAVKHKNIATDFALNKLVFRINDISCKYIHFQTEVLKLTINLHIKNNDIIWDQKWSDQSTSNTILSCASSIWSLMCLMSFNYFSLHNNTSLAKKILLIFVFFKIFNTFSIFFWYTFPFLRHSFNSHTQKLRKLYVLLSIR